MLVLIALYFAVAPLLDEARGSGFHSVIVEFILFISIGLGFPLLGVCILLLMLFCLSSFQMTKCFTCDLDNLNGEAVCTWWLE